MATSDYYFNDPVKGTEFFTSQLRQGHKWTTHVSDILNSNDIKCRVDKMRVAQTVEERKQFHNEQDVILTAMPGCIEVKSQSCHFTSDPNSWPYRKTIVDTALGWSRKSPKPLAVVLVCIHTGDKLVIPASTEHTWVPEERYDRYRHITDTFLLAERSVLRPFSEFVEWLQNRQQRFANSH